MPELEVKESVYRVTVRVTLRESILDPQGNATQHALETLGFDSVRRVRIGKLVELEIRADSDESARTIAGQACEKLLANPVMDNFEVLDVEGSD
jgi:phosphoribosylformylglycinamidine synthase